MLCHECGIKLKHVAKTCSICMETRNKSVLFSNWLHQQRHKQTKDKRYKVLSNMGENRREDCS